MSSEEKIPLGWIKVKSKSRPDKFYFYNKDKKLSVWRLEDCKNALKVIAANGPRRTPKKSPQKQSGGRVSDNSKVIHKRNIAEERMKKLKTVLAEEAKRGNESKRSEKDSNVLKDSSIKFENVQNRPLESVNSESSNAIVPEKEAVTADVNQNHAIITSDESMEIDEQSEKSQELPEVEPMEWEEIDEKVAVEEVHNVRSKEYESTSMNCTNKRIKSCESEFYIIVDTNVFLSNLKLIRDIKGMDFKGIGKAVIYLPYIVLCELDKLKMREQNIARQARAAINFINKCFSAKDEFLIGQSALESSREIIEIDNGDDYIINSGLQVLEMTEKAIVLSNDTNLRNKATVNELNAFSSDMLCFVDFNKKGEITFE